MKWDKYSQVLASNPDVATAIIRRVGPLELHCSPVPHEKVRKWVEERLRYVAVRPFASLDLQAQDEAYGQGAAYRSVTYDIWFHVGDERPSSRARYLSSDGHTTLQQLIQHLVDWHNHPECWLGMSDTHPLVLEVIVCRRLFGDPLPQEGIDVYKVPANFQLPAPSDTQPV